MHWTFTKMQGAGNDFIVLDGVRQRLQLTPARARALAHRHFGIGADQILLVEPATHPNAHFRYRIFNADGGEVEHCGNGARCFARFVRHQGLSQANPLVAEISTSLLSLHTHNDGTVTVEMGATRFGPEAVGFNSQGLNRQQEGHDTLWQLPTEPPVWLSLVAIANPHAVQVVSNLREAPVAQLGAQIERHSRFSQGVNAGFMQVLTAQHIALRVYERGVGETLSCGTGACAAVVAGIRRGLLHSPVRVDTRGGTLHIEWRHNQLRLTGPAQTVFEGTIALDRIDQLLPEGI